MRIRTHLFAVPLVMVLAFGCTEPPPSGDSDTTGKATVSAGPKVSAKSTSKKRPPKNPGAFLGPEGVVD